MKGKTRAQKGITLIALIITIVVLLILAAVAISSITGDGILSYAQNATNSYNQAAGNEQDMLQQYVNYLNNHTGSSNNGGGSTPEPVPAAGSATFSDGVSLTWEEVMLDENGTKYKYDAYRIGETGPGWNAFYECESLVSITLPDGSTTIGDGVFDGCSSLTSIVIPGSVTSISYCAFSMCNSLKNITFNGTTAQWNSITKGEYWNIDIPATHVQCSDGQVSLS